MISAQLSYLQVSQQVQRGACCGAVHSVDSVRHATQPPTPVRGSKSLSIECRHAPEGIRGGPVPPTVHSPTDSVHSSSPSPRRSTRTLPGSINARAVAIAEEARLQPPSPGKARLGHRHGPTHRGTQRPPCHGRPLAPACLSPGRLQLQNQCLALQVCWVPTCCLACSGSLTSRTSLPQTCRPNEPCRPPCLPQPACWDSTHGPLRTVTRPSSTAWPTSQCPASRS